MEIEKIRNEVNFKIREKLLRIFKYNIDVLPQKMKENFKSQIEKVESLIQLDYSQAQEDISLVEKAANSKENFKEINEKITKYKEKDPALVRKLEVAVDTKFDNLIESTEKLDSYNYQTICAKFSSINDFLTTFGYDKVDQSSAIIKPLLQRFVNDILDQNENEAKALEILYQLLDNNGGFVPLAKIMNIEDYNTVAKEFYSAKMKIISICNALYDKFEFNVMEKHEFSHLPA